MHTKQSDENLNKNPFLLKAIGKGAPYFIKTPWWLKKIYPNRVWDISTSEKIIYLTFDDGPHPVATPFVLNELKKYNAKATFFCIGKNVIDHPSVYESIKAEGHSIGNHTQHHLNGWEIPDYLYVKDVTMAAQYISSDLFRPPYGRLKSSQAKQLKDFKIIMWDVLSGDFDESTSDEQCLKNVVDKTVPGSIIVFHDNEKAFPRLQYALPRSLKFFSEQGYAFSPL